jgi:hypothetical protein
MSEQAGHPNHKRLRRSIAEMAAIRQSSFASASTLETVGRFQRHSAKQPLFRLGWLVALLAALAGCQHSTADDAKVGSYGIDFVCQSEDFKGRLEVTFAGDNRLPAHFLEQTFSESAGSDRGMSPARTPLPHEIDATLTPDKGPPRKFHLMVPSVEGRRDYLSNMYIIVQKDKTVSVKITLNPRPLHEMNKLSEEKHRFAYTLLPDEADPKYQQYRELCEAAPAGGRGK